MAEMIQTAGQQDVHAGQGKPGLLVLGGGGHGRVVAEAASLSGRFSRLLAVDPQASEGWDFFLCPCVGTEDEAGAEPADWQFVAAVGNPELRGHLFAQYEAKGFEPANVIHPRAVVSPSARLGRGVTVLAGAVIATRAWLGDGAIVNHGAVVEHDCEVSSFAHVAPGAVLAGGACLGERTFLGAAASVRHGVRICADVTIGNGAAVTADISVPGTYVGMPARLLQRATESREEK